MSFESPDQAPMFHIIGEDFKGPDCVSETCNMIAGLRFARYTGPTDLQPISYAAKLVCHGRRDAAPKEQELLQRLGQPTTRICDIEIKYYVP